MLPVSYSADPQLIFKNSSDAYQSYEPNAIKDSHVVETSTTETKLKDWDVLIENIRESYIKQRLDDAYRKVLAFEEIQKSLSVDEAKVFSKFIEKHKLLIESIKGDFIYMKQVLEELDVEEGWNVEKSGDLKVWYKKQEHSGSITLRMEAEVDIPLINMITLINEVDLWPLWVAFVNKTEEIKTIHRGAKIYYLEAGLPYPLPRRCMHIYGMGINRLFENGTVMVIARSIDHDNEFFARHDAHKKENNITTCEISLGGFEVQPLGPNKIKFRGVANANPNFSWLPDSLLNFVVRKGSGLIFNYIIKHAKNYKGSVWEKETQKPEKKEFYDWLNQEVDQYFEREAVLEAKKL